MRELDWDQTVLRLFESLHNHKILVVVWTSNNGCTVYFHILYYDGRDTELNRSPGNRTQIWNNKLINTQKVNKYNFWKSLVCRICKYVRKDSVIKTKSSEVRLFANGNCETKVAIYVLGCNKCPETFYVGQTINLRSRINNHLSSIRRNNSDQKIHKHFNLVAHIICEIINLSLSLLITVWILKFSYLT